MAKAKKISKFHALGMKIQKLRKSHGLKAARLTAAKYNTVAKREAELAKLKARYQVTYTKYSKYSSFVKAAQKYGLKPSDKSIAKLFRQRKAGSWKGFVKAAKGSGLKLDEVAKLWKATSFIASSSKEDGQLSYPKKFMGFRANPASAATLIAFGIGFMLARSQK